ncbi:AAA family ATPase [Frankia sp. Cas4]|uniref:cytidylate kinase-like family protein n=1 Tax=Frankia sp. Cas4 TaxID=3073927 RepID=UPI002AD5A9E6|nr:cytidylate kinase family protein [Frankia sp. Cas4]
MFPSHRPNVAFAGLTAAGKTTHARRLAADLGYDYVSATDVMLAILGIDTPSDGVWFERFDEIQAARRGDAADAELDRHLVALAATRQGTVFDTWALAWLSPSPMVRIWIESDLESRARKCLVSQERTRLSLRDCRELVRAKDHDTRDRFVRRHGFDLFTDRARYDLIVCNSHLIPAADRECADAGIAIFTPVVREAVTGVLQSRPHAELARIAARYPAEILRIGPRRLAAGAEQETAPDSESR